MQTRMSYVIRITYTVNALVAIVVASAAATIQEHLPKSARLTKEAWLLYDPGDPKPGQERKKPDYAAAIKIADEVITEFRADAKLTQEELVAKVKKGDKQEPPIGKRKTKEVFDKVMEHGAINDVASCYLLKGKSYLMLKEYKKARAAFESGCAFTMARAWDPGPDPTSKGYPGYNDDGWLWSQARACKAQLADMDREKL